MLLVVSAMIPVMHRIRTSAKLFWSLQERVMIMQRHTKKIYRRIRRVLVILLPILTISLAALLIAGGYISRNQENGTDNAPALADNHADPAAPVQSAQDEEHAPDDNAPDTADQAVEENPPKEPEPAVMAEPVTLLFTGDVLLSDYVLNNYKSNGIDGVLSPELQDEMKSSDITVINNEFPFSTRGTQAPDKQFTFRVDPAYVSLLTDMGVDIAGLANNHVLDYGTQALLDTFDTLDNAGIDYIGAGNDIARASALITKQAGGKTFGFLAASRVIPVVSWDVRNATPGVFTTYDPALLVAAIEQAKDRCDYLTVFVHWGIERDEYPQDYQVSMAEQYIDAGADLVIGSHPHVLQGITYYKDKPIFYSLGNFIFNQNIAQTAAVKVTVDGENEPVVQLIAASASNARTAACEDAQKAEIYKYLERISSGIAIDENGTLSRNTQ